jgi:hypothetical protein
MAKAPGTVPLLSPAMPQALRDRLRQPHGFASDTAMWPWVRQAYGVPLAYNTGHKFVRYTLRAKLQVPRNSQIKKTLKGSRPFRKMFQTSCRRNVPRASPGCNHRRSALGASFAGRKVALGGGRCNGDASR